MRSDGKLSIVYTSTVGVPLTREWKSKLQEVVTTNLLFGLEVGLNFCTYPVQLSDHHLSGLKT